MRHWFKSHSNYPAFYKQYLDLIQDEGFSQDIISMDMETSELDPKKAEILSFGSISIENGKIIPGSEQHHFFHVDNPTETSIAIHELFGAKESGHKTDTLPLILEHISNHIILGHYIQFDIDLINAQLKKYKLPKLKNPRLDTLHMALRKDGIHDYQYASRNDYTLYALCNRFGIDIEQTHDALADAYLTALLYQHLL